MFPDISSIIGGLDPSQWSSALAAAGVPPDALTANAQESAPMGGMPPPAPMPEGGEAAPMGGMPSPWEPVQGSPAGPPVQAGEAPPAGAATPGAQPPAGGAGGSLVNALRGMVAPSVPQPQRVSSPAAPHPTGKIEGGGLVSLLGQLGMLRGAHMPASYQLPSTLGAALGGR